MTFVVYALGMSMMLVAITIVMALGKQTIVGRLRSSARYINRASGVILVLAGAYIVWFWATNLGEGADALNDSGAFRLTETLSQRGHGDLRRERADVGARVRWRDRRSRRLRLPPGHWQAIAPRRAQRACCRGRGSGARRRRRVRFPQPSPDQTRVRSPPTPRP